MQALNIRHVLFRAIIVRRKAPVRVMHLMKIHRPQEARMPPDFRRDTDVKNRDSHIDHTLIPYVELVVFLKGLNLLVIRASSEKTPHLVHAEPLLHVGAPVALVGVVLELDGREGDDVLVLLVVDEGFDVADCSFEFLFFGGPGGLGGIGLWLGGWNGVIQGVLMLGFLVCIHEVGVSG